MQFKKLFLFLFVSVLSFSLKAQEEVSFPETGNYSVQLGIGQLPKRYNKVMITSTTFQTMLDDQVLRYYRIVSQNGTTYEVEQYFLTDDYPKRDRERLTLTINSHTADTYNISLVFMTGITDQVNLVKN